MEKKLTEEKTLKNGNQTRQYIMTLIITLLALVIIVGYTFGSFYRITRQDAITLGENAVTREAAQMNNFLLKGTDVMQVTEMTVSYMLKNGASSAEIEAFLKQQSKDYEENISSDFTGIYGWFHGEYIDGSGWIPPDDYVPKERPWYTEAQQGNGDLVMVSPYQDTKTNTILFSVAQVLYDGDSVISFDIAMDEVQTIAESIRLNGNGYGFVLDDQGMVVAHHDEWEKGKNYLKDQDYQGSDLQKLVKQVYRNKEKDNLSFEMEIDGEEFVTQICNAAPLHDVGKIMISDAILNKPGKFTPEEYAIMQTHSEVGGRIVKDILGNGTDETLIRISSDVAHYHHEKWDGSGYPSGLQGEEIPLCARIMAVADVFDALVSKRVYKEAMGFEEAYHILQMEAGTHFDPELVEVFVAIQGQVRNYLRDKGM